jgi:protein involved in polysaccharide export with SLBB domain
MVITGTIYAVYTSTGSLEVKTEDNLKTVLLDTPVVVVDMDTWESIQKILTAVKEPGRMDAL